MNVGTMPPSIHVVDNNAINTNIGMAGSICRALNLRPSLNLRGFFLMWPMDRATHMAADERSTYGPKSEIDDAPSIAIRPTSVRSRKIIGIIEYPNFGPLATKLSFLLFSVISIIF